MDYENLLKKYMSYISDCEGIDYVRNGPYGHKTAEQLGFSSEEWAELERISGEQS